MRTARAGVSRVCAAALAVRIAETIVTARMGFGILDLVPES
jgi:hypothetical protein